MGSTGQPCLSLPQGLQLGYGADGDPINHNPTLEEEVRGQGLEVCQSDLLSGLVMDISEGEPIIRVRHKTYILPSDNNTLEEVVSVKVPPGH